MRLIKASVYLYAIWIVALIFIRLPYAFAYIMADMAEWEIFGPHLIHFAYIAVLAANLLIILNFRKEYLKNATALSNCFVALAATVFLIPILKISQWYLFPILLAGTFGASLGLYMQNKADENGSVNRYMKFVVTVCIFLSILAWALYIFLFIRILGYHYDKNILIFTLGHGYLTVMVLNLYMLLSRKVFRTIIVILNTILIFVFPFGIVYWSTLWDAPAMTGLLLGPIGIYIWLQNWVHRTRKLGENYGQSPIND